MVAIYVHDVIRQVADLYRHLLEKFPGTWTVAEFLGLQADHLFAEHRKGNPAVCMQINNWLPRLIGARNEAVLAAPFALEDARTILAREHGFDCWAKVLEDGDHRPDAAFEQAVNAVVNGDLAALEESLRQRPRLVRDRSQFGHRATLLHYVAANGVETWRQQVPANAGDVTRLLIEAGADPAAPAQIYGGGQDTMALLMSSAHPREAGVTRDIAKALVQGTIA